MQKTTVSDNSFWENVAEKEVPKSKPRHNAIELVAKTKHELNALQVFMNKPSISLEAIVPVARDEDNSKNDLLVVSNASSTATEASVNFDLDESPDVTLEDLVLTVTETKALGMEDCVDIRETKRQKKLDKKKDQEKALVKLGRVSRYKLNLDCLKDPFAVGEKNWRILCPSKWRNYKRKR